MITLQNVSKSFRMPQSNLPVLQSISLTINKGEIHGIIGASGAGKSTLLRVMNLLEKPDMGSVMVDHQLLTQLSGRELRNVRRSIGMIFQHFNLLANKTVFDNVVVPLELAGYSKKSKKERVLECLQFVGLNQKAGHYPAQLSGGQKQRVAIARALANKPTVLLCDEPTGALDYNTGKSILKLLQNMCREKGMTVIIITHNQALAPMADRLIHIKNGQVARMESNENPTSIDEIEW